MKKIIFSIICIVSVCFIASCKKALPDPGATSAVKVSNEWRANLYQGGVAQNASASKFATYNVAGSSDSIWIDDFGKLWNFKCKVKYDPINLTFQTTNSVNEYYPISITITNGKIFPKAGKSATGVVTDSIYMKVVFSDDPGAYEIKGTGRTNWLADGVN